MAFLVRVYVGNSPPMVLPGGVDPLGAYIETRQASGVGYHATPGKRISVSKKQLRPLPAGSDADFELIGQLSPEAF